MNDRPSATELLAAVEGHPNIQVLLQATCNGWFPCLRR